MFTGQVNLQYFKYFLKYLPLCLQDRWTHYLKYFLKYLPLCLQDRWTLKKYLTSTMHRTNWYAQSLVNSQLFLNFWLRILMLGTSECSTWFPRTQECSQRGSCLMISKYNSVLGNNKWTLLFDFFFPNIQGDPERLSQVIVF